MRDLLDINLYSCEKPKECYNLDDMPLAYSYVPYQPYETPYNKESALKYGTAFPKLNKPFGVYGIELKKEMGEENRCQKL